MSQMLGLSMREFWHEVAPWEFILRVQGFYLENGLTVTGELPDNEEANTTRREDFKRRMVEFGEAGYAAQMEGLDADG